MSEKRIEGSAELANTLEALANLLYLIRLDRNSPDQVLHWVDMADGQSERMESILQW
jgi:hypothetical protein